MDWLSWKYYQRARERRDTMLKCRSKSHNTLRNFLLGNRLQQLEVACAKRVSVYTLPTILAICKRKYFSVKAFILISLWHFVHQAMSKTSEQLVRRFNLSRTLRRLLSSFVKIGRKYSAYWIPYLAAAIYHCCYLLAAANGCCRKLHEKLWSVGLES